MKLIDIKLNRKKATLVTDKGEFSLFEDDYFENLAYMAVDCEIDEKGEELILSLSRVYQLVKKGLLKLSYSDSSAKALYLKLLREKTDYGIPNAEEAKSAVIRLKRLGYINEESYCRRCLEIELSKLHGRARIYKELMAKGFSSSLVKRILDGVCEDIYLENLKRLIEKNSNRDKRNLTAFLYRQGYDFAMISECLYE